jgi:hypothetical protein
MIQWSLCLDLFVTMQKLLEFNNSSKYHIYIKHYSHVRSSCAAGDLAHSEVYFLLFGCLFMLLLEIFSQNLWLWLKQGKKVKKNICQTCLFTLFHHPNYLCINTPTILFSHYIPVYSSSSKILRPARMKINITHFKTVLHRLNVVNFFFFPLQIKVYSIVISCRFPPSCQNGKPLPRFSIFFLRKRKRVIFYKIWKENEWLKRNNDCNHKNKI